MLFQKRLNNSKTKSFRIKIKFKDQVLLANQARFLFKDLKQEIEY